MFWFFVVLRPMFVFMLLYAIKKNISIKFQQLSVIHFALLLVQSGFNKAIVIFTNSFIMPRENFQFPGGIIIIPRVLLLLSRVI